MRGLGAAIGLALLLGAAGSGSTADAPIDAALGDVDGHLIALSDVALARGLGVFNLEPSTSPIGASDLDRYIDAQLAIAEATRLGIELPADAVDRAWNSAGRDALGARLDEAGVDHGWARRLIEADLRIQRFVELRFRAFAFVTESDIDAALGPGPHDGPARDRARDRLRADAVTQALAAWRQSARERAAIRLAPGSAGPWAAPFSLPGLAGR